MLEYILNFLDRLFVTRTKKTIFFCWAAKGGVASFPGESIFLQPSCGDRLFTREKKEIFVFTFRSNFTFSELQIHVITGGGKVTYILPPIRRSSRTRPNTPLRTRPGRRDP